MAKNELKIKAVELRRQGCTYSEILKVVPVAKSTLSLWFHEVLLAEHQIQRITQKRIDGQKRGAEARRKQRIELQERIWSESEKEVGRLSDRELWLIGIALYWAEGSKEKDWNPGNGIVFSNSDPKMIKVFLVWINNFMDTAPEKIGFEIYIHESKKDPLDSVVDFWSRETGFPKLSFGRIYFKKNKINTKRRNVGFLYNGVLRVKIRESSALLRRVEGWTRGIIHNCRIV